MAKNTSLRSALWERGLTVTQWAAGHDFPVSAIHNALRGTASADLAARVLAALAQDGLLEIARKPATGAAPDAGLATGKEVAAYLNMNRSTIWRWGRTGENGFPRAIRLGRTVRYDMEKVKAWVNKMRGF